MYPTQQASNFKNYFTEINNHVSSDEKVKKRQLEMINSIVPKMYPTSNLEWQVSSLSLMKDTENYIEVACGWNNCVHLYWKKICVGKSGHKHWSKWMFTHLKHEY